MVAVVAAVGGQGIWSVLLEAVQRSIPSGRNLLRVPLRSGTRTDCLDGRDAIGAFRFMRVCSARDEVNLCRRGIGRQSVDPPR